MPDLPLVGFPTRRSADIFFRIPASAPNLAVNS
jgi:hypothetical protein